jgi:hypothetical protein
LILVHDRNWQQAILATLQLERAVVKRDGKIEQLVQLANTNEMSALQTLEGAIFDVCLVVEPVRVLG